MTVLVEAVTPGAVNPIANGLFDVVLGSSSLFTPFKSGTPMAQVTASWTAGQKAEARVNVSPPLVGPGILDGAVRAYALSLSPGTANARARLEVYVVSHDGMTVRGTALAIADYSTGTGFNTTLRNKAWADGDALTPVVFQDQDRIVVKRGFTDAAGTTPQATVQFGDVVGSTNVGTNETDTSASLAGFIEFSKTLSFYAASVNNLDTKLSVNVTSIVSNAATPSSNALQLVACWQGTSTALTAPTGCTGCGLTWEVVFTFTNGVDERLTVFRGMGTFPTPGSVTVTFAGLNNRPCLAWLEVLGVDQSGSNGSGAIAASASLTGGASVASPFNVSLAAPTTKPDNVVFSWFGTGVNTPAFTPRAGWGFRQSVNNGNLLNYSVYYRANAEQTAGVSYSGTAGGPFGAILEVNVLAPVSVPSDPPVITRLSPDLGPIAVTDVLSVRIADPDGDLTLVAVSAEFATLGTTETVYDGALVSPYATSSTATPGALAGDVDLAILRSGGWPDASGVTLHVIAVDSNGNLVTADFTWGPVDFGSVEAPDVDLAVVQGANGNRDIKIDPTTGRFSLTSTGDISFVGGAESVAQAVRQKLRAFLGEYYLDESVGVDWWGQVLIKNPNLAAVRTLIRTNIEEVPGIGSIETFNVDFTAGTRGLSVDFTATTDTGELITSSFALAQVA